MGVNVYSGPAPVVPEEVIRNWKDSLDVVLVDDCPQEVKEFIDAIAAKMPDFGQIGKHMARISGAELLLANMKEINGESVYPHYFYELPVPHMVAVDHHRWMLRAYRRRGKQGLIDYCRARVEGTELQRVLAILEVHVFHSNRDEYNKVMAEIRASKKLDNKMDV